MAGLDDHRDTHIYYPRIRWRTTFSANKIVIVLILLVLTLSIPALYVTPYLVRHVLHTYGVPAMFIFSITFPFPYAFGSFFVLKTLDRHFFSRNYLRLIKLESIARANPELLTFEQRHELIDCALRVNHRAVADHYSTQLLMLSMDGSEEKNLFSKWMVSTDCWASTGKFDSDWKKKLFTVYESRGILSVSPQLISLQANSFEFECHPSKLKKIEIKQQPRLLTLITHKYLFLTIDEDGEEHTFIVRPSRVLTDLVWVLNKKVEDWAKIFEQARNFARET